MEGRSVEPRTALWAVAEVSWEDHTGTSNRIPATLEDTSASGACIRVKSPITVGSKVTVKWHREQFSGIARNCRNDGREFLLGVRRVTDQSPVQPLKESVSLPAAVHGTAEKPKGKVPTAACEPIPASAALDTPEATRPSSRREPFTLPSTREKYSTKSTVPRAEPSPRLQAQPEGASMRRERKAMQSKGFFPNLWRRQDETPASQKLTPAEALMPKSQTHRAEGLDRT